MASLDQEPLHLPVSPGFSIVNQTLDLDIDFSERVSGKTEITLYPDSKDLKEVKLDAKQCHIDRILINGLRPQSMSYRDPCDSLRLHADGTGVHQHHILSEKIGDESTGGGELVLVLPKTLKIEEVNLTEVHTQTAGTIKIAQSDAVNVAESTQALADTSVAKFTPLSISIEFTSLHLHDGLNFVTGKPGNGRWPHLYTRGSVCSGSTSCIFPCLDSLNARCTWDITIRCPRTVGDALRQCSPSSMAEGMTINRNAEDESSSSTKSREMIVICSGDVTDDAVDKTSPTRKTVSFSCSQQLSAQQIGFAIGPFEKIDLSALRDAQDEEELGQNAVEMLAYCLPGRAEEVKNTCLPMPNAMDFIVRRYLACPSSTYMMCFVEDAFALTSIFAGLTMCSTRLLYPADVIDAAQEVTRELVHAIASQWVGINIVAEDPRDTWVIIGITHFITDTYMKDLCGNNEYRFRMKKQSDLVFETDHERPSIYDMGALLHIDPSEHEFLSLKAPVVLFILDRRIAKVAGTSKMPGIIGKILTRARIGDMPNNFLSTDTFQKTCERFYHAKIDDFINQWVKGAGCPRFQVMQRFNKKKLVVEMVIQQVHANQPAERDLEVDTFMRDVREDFQIVYAAPPQPVFTGSMTIRIHEADGTPYEHIVDLKDAKTTFDIPYNTKYKRLKRSKKSKSKNVAETIDADNDALLYCLGDVLQTEDDVASWRLTDWSEDDENRMSAESYEWIRIDADFEWISQIQLQMPGYMSVSQLQQDRDVVAQYESIRHINSYPASPLISSILLRTMIDRRYFHGIRSLAARSLAKHAKESPEVDNIGLFHLRKAFEELYCTTEHGSSMTRPNDFSDIQSYYLQSEIIESISRVRNEEGFTPREVKEFLLDKLKFNDNTSNDYSDAFYVSRLMKALCSAVVAKSHKRKDPEGIDLGVIDEEQATKRIEDECLAEIDRYRRMDEWTSSYQNLYSRTALECQQKLNEARIGQSSPVHFLQYTRPGNYELLRLSAYEILVKSDIFSSKSVLKYVLHCMVADASPLIRESLSTAFGKALAFRAIGKAVEDAVMVQDQDGLVIEDTDTSEVRQKAMARRRTIEGALAALKEELTKNEDLQKFLWAAMNHPDIGLKDLRPLLDFCRMLYEPIDQMKVSLKYPRYWKVERVQGAKPGVLRFSRTGVRTKRIEKKWQPPLPPPVEPKKSSALPMKLLFKHGLNARPSPTPTPPAVHEQVSQLAAQPKLKLKFKSLKQEGE